MPEDTRRRYSWLADALEHDGAVLTASHRLARELRAAFNEQQMERGTGAWNTPRIWYWQDWAREVVKDAAPPEATRILGAIASAVLWERCLRDHLDEELLGVGLLTRQAVIAWQRLGDWLVPLIDLERSAGSRDERVYARAARDYQALLSARGWIDAAALARVAVAQLVAGSAPLPARVRMAGFDRQTPVVEALSDALRERGTEVTSVRAALDSTALRSCQFADVEAELRGAGSWARQVLESQPGARIGVICPDLDTRAEQYARLVREGLAPGWQTGGREYETAVDVSFGRRLADYPAIAVALLLLRWIGRDIPSRDVSLLLRSPFLHGPDHGARARLELVLRQMPDRQWTAASLGAALSESGGDGTDWLDNVTRVASLQSIAVERRALSAWAEFIDATLTSMGWPGTAPLDSVEFQLMNRWRELLNELAALDIVVPQATLTDAVARLAALARETVFQPESRGGLVSLLGPLEAAGLEFDHLWICGMDANHWPAPGNPLALVSRRLQRDYRMPDSTPAESLAYSHRVLERMAGSSPQVSFSWAQSDGDAAQLPSPLLDVLPLTENTVGNEPGWYAAGIVGRADVRDVADDPVPPVAVRERVAGGASTISRQWHEPFLAFAHGRLGVSLLDRYQPGLSAKLRGILLHDALFELFRETPDQESIRSWQSSERRLRIARALDRAFVRVERHADSVLRRLLALERVRLALLLNDFLDAELERSPFRIERVEEEVGFRHAGVELVLRVDRVDRLPDASVLIIDYKTGAYRNLLDKDGEPTEPQVVVYAAATHEPVGGLALINVNRRAIDYRGAGAGVDWRRFDPAEWETALHRWQGDVLAAMEEIAAGDARVLLYPGAAGHGQLGVLSRFEELRRD